MIKIMIADDHVLIREGLKRLLSGAADVCIAAECDDGAQVLSCLQGEACDVLILDLLLPGRSGLEVLHELRSGAVESRPRALVLSGQTEDEMVYRTLRAGAAGFLSKSSCATEVEQAIRVVHAGGRFVSPPLDRRLAHYEGRKQDRDPRERLSPREFNILQRLADGMSVDAIALELTLSASTVKTYRQRIQEKLGLACHAELMRYAIRYSLGAA